MRIIGLFDKYFLILLLVQGFISAQIDYTAFREANMPKVARKCRILGMTFIIGSIVLYVISNFILG